VGAATQGEAVDFQTTVFKTERMIGGKRKKGKKIKGCTKKRRRQDTGEDESQPEKKKKKINRKSGITLH